MMHKRGGFLANQASRKSIWIPPHSYSAVLGNGFREVMLAWLQLALSSPEDQRHPASVEKDASSCGPHSRRASCVIPSPAPDAPLTMGDRMEAAALDSSSCISHLRGAASVS